MSGQHPKPEEFIQVWLRCISAMDLLVAEKGYAALTFQDISLHAAIPVTTLTNYFGNEKNLREMYDQLTVLNQTAKNKFGGEPIN